MPIRLKFRDIRRASGLIELPDTGYAAAHLVSGGAASKFGKAYSLCLQFLLALDLRPGQPIRFILEPPGFALHAWSPETGLVSHVAPIGDYGPSRDF